MTVCFLQIFPAFGNSEVSRISVPDRTVDGKNSVV